MYEIKIKVHPNFWKSWDKDIINEKMPYLIERVASICCAHPNPHRQEQGYDWALDNSNDWKAERRDDVLIVAYRYGDGNDEHMLSLKTFLQSSMVIGEMNKKIKSEGIEVECITPAQKWVKMWRARIKRNGKYGTWEFVSRKKTPEIISGESKADAVIIIPFIRSNKHYNDNPVCFDELLVIKEFRYPINDYEFGFPAGLIDPGEDLIVTASRELSEETGYQIDEIITITPPLYSSTGLSDESTVFVYAYVSKAGPAKLEGMEDIELVPMGKEELTKLIQREAPYENAKISCKLWPIAHSLIFPQLQMV